MPLQACTSTFFELVQRHTWFHSLIFPHFDYWHKIIKKPSSFYILSKYDVCSYSVELVSIEHHHILFHVMQDRQNLSIYLIHWYNQQFQWKSLSFIITKQKMFMEIYIFINITKEVKHKQKFILITEYRNECSILYIFIFSVHFVYFCTFTY